MVTDDARVPTILVGESTGIGMNRHRSLPVWQAARRLVVEIYRLTRSLPQEE
jgi:hypothetical protein